LVHKIYICYNMKYSFGLQYHFQIRGCSNTTNVMQGFPSFSLMQQGQAKEGKHYSLWRCSMANTLCSNIKQAFLNAIVACRGRLAAKMGRMIGTSHAWIQPH